MSSEKPQINPREDGSERPVLSFNEKKFGKPGMHLADLSRAERRAMVKKMGYQQFRADQLSRHYFEHFTTNPEDMSDLPARQRASLTQAMFPPLLSKIKDHVADGGATIKTLWRLFDEATIETVLMAYPDRTTLCISSQAGCGMACPFCATGQGGLVRNLTAAEIVEQVRLAMAAISNNTLSSGHFRQLTHIVFMGMGEPLANYKAVAEALRRLVSPSPEGFGLSARNITVSTVGIIPGIHKLAELGLPLTLAVSLHAPDDDLRDDLIPINTRYKVDPLLDSARHYFVRTGRRVSIEYALIKDMNDHPWRAQLLAEKLNNRGHGWVHVNPIPLNPTPGSIWTCSTRYAQEKFVQTLRDHAIPTTIRDTRGSDVDGACGQLAASVVDPEHIAMRAAQAQKAVNSRIKAA